MELDAHRMEGPVHVMKDGSDTNVFSVSEMNMYQKSFHLKSLCHSMKSE